MQCIFFLFYFISPPDFCQKRYKNSLSLKNEQTLAWNRQAAVGFVLPRAAQAPGRICGASGAAACTRLSSSQEFSPGSNRSSKRLLQSRKEN